MLLDKLARLTVFENRETAMLSMCSGCALSCIDQAVLIWDEYCDNSVVRSENFKKFLPAVDLLWHTTV